LSISYLLSLASTANIIKPGTCSRSPDGGIEEKDQKFVLLEEAISAALKEGKRPEL